MSDKSIKEQVVYIKSVKEKYGLSCERICEIVSHTGFYVSVSTVRRLTAPEAEVKRFRNETIAPVFMGLLEMYGDGDSAPTFSDPVLAYPHFDRYQYERLISILKDSNSELLKETENQKALIGKQNKMIDVLWQGLLTFGESREEFAAIIKYYLKGR